MSAADLAATKRIAVDILEEVTMGLRSGAYIRERAQELAAALDRIEADTLTRDEARSLLSWLGGPAEYDDPDAVAKLERIAGEQT